jgi:hypothetical protein
LRQHEFFQIRQRNTAQATQSLTKLARCAAHYARSDF